MSTGMANDEVIDAIAHIEMQRQEMEKESGLAAACSEALRRLHELLDREQAAPQLHGPGTGHLANVEAVMIEIKRIKKLVGITNQGAISKHPRPRQHQVSLRSGARNPSRNKGRRTMGRRGDR